MSTNYPVPQICYDVNNTNGGVYKYKTRSVHYNPVLLALNKDVYLETTVPHEVAHYLQFEFFGVKCKPHGPEWVKVMIIIGAKPNRCHSYDVKYVKRRNIRRIQIKCGCRSYQVTQSLITRRNLLGNNVICRKCLKKYEKV